MLLTLALFSRLPALPVLPANLRLPPVCDPLPAHPLLRGAPNSRSDRRRRTVVS